MEYKFRIDDVELLDKNHFPIKALFNAVSNSRFMEVLEGLSNGKGFGENYGACVFWNDLDDYDKLNTPEYEGVEFGLNNGEEVIIGYHELYYYLKIICKKYCEEFPLNKIKANAILNNYKSRYNVKD